MIIRLPEVLVALPKVVPASLKKISPPSASKIISVVASRVIVEPEFTAVVALRVVIVADVCVPATTPDIFGATSEITVAEALIPEDKASPSPSAV